MQCNINSFRGIKQLREHKQLLYALIVGWPRTGFREFTRHNPWSFYAVSENPSKISLRFVDRVIWNWTTWLTEIPAPIGSQKGVGHSHKWPLFIAQYLPQSRMGSQAFTVWHPTCTHLLSGVGNPSIITSKNQMDAGISVNLGWKRWAITHPTAPEEFMHFNDGI